MSDIVIVGAARTAVGSFLGSFANVPAHELGAAAIGAALERAGVSTTDVDEVILGQVLTAGAGPEPRLPGRHSAIGDGFRRQPSLRLRLARRGAGMQQIANGDAGMIIAGGQESMSCLPLPEPARRHQDGRNYAGGHDAERGA